MTPRHFIAASLVLIGSMTTGHAQETERALAETPRATVGKRFEVRDMGCVDPGATSFVCVKFVGPTLLEIRGDFLSPETPLSIAERLVRTCRGTAQIDNPECRMRVSGQVRVTESRIVEGERGSFPHVRIEVGAIDIRR